MIKKYKEKRRNEDAKKGKSVVISKKEVRDYGATNNCDCVMSYEKAWGPWAQACGKEVIIFVPFGDLWDDFVGKWKQVSHGMEDDMLVLGLA